MRYTSTGKDKENGVVYTPADMAEYVADEIIKYHDLQFDDVISILDPAAGKGELLVAMIKASGIFHKKIKVVGYETDEIIANDTQCWLRDAFPDVIIEIRTENFLDAVENETVGKYDLVIANPPYIRTQIMGTDKSQKIAEKLGLSGRVDIYYAFLIYTKNVLKKNGVAGYITSNKFMTIKAGNSVRNYMLQNYKLHHITDMGDTKLFTASVLPCVVIFSLGKTLEKEEVAFTSVYEYTANNKKAENAESIWDSIYKNGLYKMPDGKIYNFQQGIMRSTSENSLWTIESDANHEWLLKVASNTWTTFAEIGKVRVGIKTTADNVFIGDDWTGENADLELLRPLITHRNAGQICANKNSLWQVLYTHTVKDGKKVAVDINLYPNSKEYLRKHFDQLNARNYIKKAKRNWYEIWVPQNPESFKHRKIVFRDISEHPQFWLDETGAIVNGDCYWIDIFPEVLEDVVYLALAVANSSFIEKFYDLKFNTKLYSGKRRYQTQYVEQFPIPYYGTIVSQDAIALVKKILAEGKSEIAPSDKKELDDLVDKMFS